MATKSTKDETTTKDKKANSAFMKPLTPSAALAVIVGTKPLPRSEVVKLLWVYIKKNNLQSETDKRNINADVNLKPIFGKDKITMFEMAKLIGPHLTA